jgi:hypothetical protein
MFLPNGLVYIQFHPVTYIVKLNIEMSMASLVVRLAKGLPANDMHDEPHYSSGPRSNRPHFVDEPRRTLHGANGLESFHLNSISRGQKRSSEESQVGITCRTDVIVESSDKGQSIPRSKSGSSSLSETLGMDKFGDETPLH